MNKILFKNETQYRAFVYSVLEAVDGNEPDIWAGFDREKLNLFFNWHKANNGEYDAPRTPEIQEAIDYYLWAAYDDKHLDAVEFRDSWQNADPAVVEKSFGVKVVHNCYDYDEDGNSIDEQGNLMPDDRSGPDKLVFDEFIQNITYPFVLVYWAASSFDRFGDVFMLAVDFVELKEFDDTLHKD